MTRTHRDTVDDPVPAELFDSCSNVVDRAASRAPGGDDHVAVGSLYRRKSVTERVLDPTHADDGSMHRLDPAGQLRGERVAHLPRGRDSVIDQLVT
jgi:hypothetical protein